MKWYLKVMKEHYADFSGRARRLEYWMFILFFYLFWLVGLFVAAAIGEIIGGYSAGESLMMFFCIIWFIAHFIPLLSSQVRRLHDAGYSGWCLLFSLIPYLGSFILFILLLMNTVPGPNRWGPNPKNIGGEKISSSYNIKKESVSDEILKYTKMKEAGALTEEEFKKIKEKLLDLDGNTTNTKNDDINFE